ncbi:MAG: glycosyltransferase family 4 protein [Solirubrobacterales bacterium]
MRIRVIDPASYTRPYDHALCAALAHRGNDVELVASRFRHGEVPQPDGYRLSEDFYRLPGPLPVRVAQHPLDMLRLRFGTQPDVTHFQWLPIQRVDRHLLPPGPVVLTAHDVIPREPRPGQLGALRATYSSVDAVVVHSEHGKGVLVERLDVDPAKVEVVPHGVFDYLTEVSDAKPLPAELAEVERPVVLCFGLWRPYKGIDLIIRAFSELKADAELWIVGMPRMPVEPLKQLATELGLGERVKFVPRFVGDSELGAYFRRADIVALPYREIDQSGVLFTALAFGKPIVATRVGGFGEIEDRFAAIATVPAEDETALAARLDQLLTSPQAREDLARAAAAAAVGELSWDRVATRTLEVYTRAIDSAVS